MSEVPVRGSVHQEVFTAARARASALAEGDENALRVLLHPDFGWTSHAGQHFDREGYIAANVKGPTRWHAQSLENVTITVVSDTAVVHCAVTDDVTTSDGRSIHRMLMTQTWVRSGGAWRCLAGHAGPSESKSTGPSC